MIENRTGILYSKGGEEGKEIEYDFYHRQFQDYLAADYVLFKGGRLVKNAFPFVENLEKNGWRSFFEFLVRIKNRGDASVFFENYISKIEQYTEHLKNNGSDKTEKGVYIENISHFVAYFDMAVNMEEKRDLKNKIKECLMRSLFF